MARFGGFFYLVLKTWPSGAVPDPALRGSELPGFAGKECELFWSAEALQNIKLQAPNYNEIPNSNIQWPKQVLNFGHCYLFDIWYLWFGIFSHSSRLPQDRNIFGQLNRPGLCEVLRDIIKSYVFWSSWWVGWFRTTGPADAFLIVRMKKIDWRPRESNRLHT